MNYNGSFNPKYLSGTQLYFAKNTATVSSWNDQSPNGYDLSQVVALQQPTIGTNSVDFVPNQFMSRNVADAFSGDSEGYIFFAINHITNQSNNILTSSDNATNNHDFRLLSSSVLAPNKITLVVRQSGVNNIVTLDTTTLINGFNYGWVRSNGSFFSGMVNGVSQSINATINNGDWFDSVINRDNLVIGATIRLSSIYSNGGVNKLYYNNTSLSASDLWKTEQFFANPLNYD
jgi:hypothetical protein